MLTPAQAWQTIHETLRPLAAKTLPLHEALLGFLASAIHADRDIPPADRAAMDGFAVRALDVAKVPQQLRIIGEVAAGSIASLAIGPGECLRIFTGANVPPGADAVVPVEDTTLRRFRDTPAGDNVTITASIPSGANIFRQGENAGKGRELLVAGTRLGPRQLAVAAACGHATLEVHARPGVAILATGAELLDAVAHLSSSHETRDSNGPMMAALCEAHRFPVVLRKSIPDDRDATRKAIAFAAARADAILMSGGVSAGPYDFVRPALEALGANIVYHGLAMKPGRPQLFAMIEGRVPVFGLPGNPLSATVGLYEFALPALRRLAGCHHDACRPTWRLALAEDMPCRGSFLRFVPARLHHAETGTRAVPLKAIGTADLVTGGLAEGAILAPPGEKLIAAGTLVDFRPWEFDK